MREKEWKIERKLILKKRKIYVSKDKKLALEVIWLHYDVLVAGHRGK